QPHFVAQDIHVTVECPAVREDVDVRNLGQVLVRERKERAQARLILVDDLHELGIEASVVVELALLDPPGADVGHGLGHGYPPSRSSVMSRLAERRRAPASSPTLSSTDVPDPPRLWASPHETELISRSARVRRSRPRVDSSRQDESRP